MTNSGTQTAVLGTAVLCLPSLLSIYYVELGLSKPLLSKKFIAKHLLFQYTVSPNEFTPRIRSPIYTILTYNFHHSDLIHFAGNIYAITTSAVSLNLGFWRTCLLMYGGSVFGVLGNMFEMCIVRNSAMSAKITTPTSVDSNSFGDFIKKQVNYVAVKYVKFHPKISVAGASAAAYSLMGASVFSSIKSIILIWRTLKKKPSNNLSEASDRERQIVRISNLIISTGINLIVFAGDIWSAFGYEIKLYDFFSSNKGAAHVGYSSHIGGFLFGVTAMSVMDRFR